MRDATHKTLKQVLDYLQAISIIVGVFFICFQVWNQSIALRVQNEALKAQNASLQDTQKVNAATFVLRVSDQLNQDKYSKIMLAIDNNTSDYPIRKHFRDTLIESYIGTFETLGDLVANSVVDQTISDAIAYDEWGYELEATWCNKDIQSFVTETRNADQPRRTGQDAFYRGFEELATYSLSRDKKTCSDVD